MDAVTLLCNGTMDAAVLILFNNGYKSKELKNSGDAEKLAADLRKALKEEIEGALKEWEEAIEANMNELWLKELLNAQCNSIALKALKDGGWL